MSAAPPLGSLAARYVAFAARRPWTLLSLGFALALASSLGLPGLKLDTRLEALLAEDSPSMLAAQLLEQRIEGEAPLILSVGSDDPALNRRLAAELLQRVSGWDDVLSAMRARDLSPFLSRRLLYIDAEGLEDYAERVEEYVDYRACAAMPGCVLFDEEAPLLPSDREVRERLAGQPIVGVLGAYLGVSAEELLEEESRERAAGEASGDGAPPERAQELELCSASGEVCAVWVTMARSPSDLDYAESILARSEALFQELRPSDAPASLRFEVSGRFRNAPAIRRQTARDLGLATSLSIALVLFVVFLQFRGARSLLLIFVPMAIALVSVFGALGAAGVEMNLISSFALAILVGIGVDFGLHLLTHYGEFRAAGAPPAEANTRALGELGHSLTVAGLTTGAAFAALSSATFRGFSQLGWMAALGVLASLVGFVLLFPPLTLALERMKERPALLRSWSWLSEARPPAVGWLRAVAAVGVVLGLGATLVASGVFGAGLEFEYEFWRLRPPGASTELDAGSAIRGGSGSVVYLMAEQPEDLEAMLAAFAEEPIPGASAERPGLLLRPADIVPVDQDRRLEALERIEEAVEVALRRARGEERARLERLQGSLALTPLTPSELPPWVRQLLVDASGEFGTLALLYVPLRGADARAMEQLSEAIAGWRARYPAITFASPVAVLGEVVPALRHDGPRVVGLAVLGLVLATLLIGRSVSRSVLVLLPVALALLTALGVMAAFGWKLNLYNLLVLPVAVGVGVDGAVYVVWAMHGAPVVDEALKTTIRAIIGSSLTTMVGFGSLMVSTNPGVDSLGALGALAIGLTLLTNVVWLPSLLLARHTPR